MKVGGKYVEIKVRGKQRDKEVGENVYRYR